MTGKDAEYTQVTSCGVTLSTSSRPETSTAQLVTRGIRTRGMYKAHSLPNTLEPFSSTVTNRHGYGEPQPIKFSPNYLSRFQIPASEGEIFSANTGQPRTCTVIDRLKVTRQGAALVRCRCRLGCTRRRCTLAPPGEYRWRRNRTNTVFEMSPDARRKLSEQRERVAGMHSIECVASRMSAISI